jgi:Helitron helicase-like domain at N-terminus
MELYNGIIDALARTNLDFELLGRCIVLPLSFLSRARFIEQYYQDLMAIVYKYGHLSIFITFTANPKWDEITYKLLPG